ncbi:hypothetical protein CDAR_458951 [Caerostris darwini]|uniref:Uncharacterized protein n=1 Tax=Caerostris darwini TaxID=1538125 RepID=A0AAV4SSY6_9ARAC|nr:hypothetical protein CDAR_458951 [Caerostris darwini]
MVGLRALRIDQRMYTVDALGHSCASAGLLSRQGHFVSYALGQAVILIVYPTGVAGGQKILIELFQIFSEGRQRPRVYLLSTAFISSILLNLLPTFWCLTSARSRPGNV